MVQHAADIIRGVSSRTVLTGFGSHLRSSGGSAETYALSEPEIELDVFLSHSWRDSGMLKYLAISFHFNARPALLCSLIVALVVFALEAQTSDGLCFRLAKFPPPEPDILAAMEPLARIVPVPPVRVLAYSVRPCAFLTFLVVVLWGHRLPFVIRGRRMFLDKICIHQTDQAKKRAGILALDEFLRRSRAIMICYQDDYLERLWCVFELAAFCEQQRSETVEKNLIFLPLLRAPCVLAVSCGFAIHFFFEHLAHQPGSPLLGRIPGSSTAAGFWVYVMVSVSVLFVVPVWLSTRSAQAKERAVAQLRSFSVEKTKCFDPNDRHVVEQQISRWFAPSNDDRSEPKGIARFEEEVQRGKVAGAVLRQLGGGAGLLNYEYVLYSQLPMFLVGLDAAAHNPFVGSWCLTHTADFLVVCPLTYYVHSAVARRLVQVSWLPFPLLLVLSSLIFAAMLIAGIVGSCVLQCFLFGGAL